MPWETTIASLLLLSGAKVIQDASLHTIDAVRQASSLRLNILLEPQGAVLNHCQTEARKSQTAVEPRRQLFQCSLHLDWRDPHAHRRHPSDHKTSWRPICPDQPRAGDARLRPARYYRIQLACQWQSTSEQVWLQLPLLATEVFR